MKRLRPDRKNQQTRDKHAETSLSIKDFIYPYFVCDTPELEKSIDGFDNMKVHSIDGLLKDMEDTAALGIDRILLFGVIPHSHKDEIGSAGLREDSLIAKAIRKIKPAFPNITVIADVCLCGYSSHGHCGIVKGSEVLNDATLPYLAKMSSVFAGAGADIVAPSSMMDGQVAAIRDELNKRGLAKTKILGYSAKYVSNLYSPFRNASSSSPSFGDRKTYQMDFRNRSEAMEEIRADIEEGADMVMVKPSLFYLDTIYQAKTEFPDIPLVAYQVSGEYMMLKEASKNGVFNETEIFKEALISVKRAGADMIISYYAKEACRWLR
jgi:porphobilinogen synthase